MADGDILIEQDAANYRRGQRAQSADALGPASPQRADRSRVEDGQQRYQREVDAGHAQPGAADHRSVEDGAEIDAGHSRDQRRADYEKRNERYGAQAVDHEQQDKPSAQATQRKQRCIGPGLGGGRPGRLEQRRQPGQRKEVGHLVGRLANPQQRRDDDQHASEKLLCRTTLGGMGNRVKTRFIADCQVGAEPSHHLPRAMGTVTAFDQVLRAFRHDSAGYQRDCEWE